MTSDRSDGPIGVGIIGLSANGGWASLAHVPALRSMPDKFRLLGLSASSEASAAEAGAVHEVPFTTGDPAKLAARSDIDLVIVTVKVPRHKALIAHAISAGKAVLSEWPLAISRSEAEGLAADADKAGVKGFVGLQARSAPAVRYLRALVVDGYVGEVLSTSMIASGDFPWGGVATADMAYVTDQSSGASMMTIPFGHTIDALTWILGDFKQITGALATRHTDVKLLDSATLITATAPDNIAVSGILEKGAIASIHFRGGRSPGSNFYWEINGTKGTLVVHGDNGHLQYGFIRIEGAQIDPKIEGDAPLVKLDVPSHYLLAATPVDSHGDAVAHAYRSIYCDIRQGTANAPRFSDAVKNHELLERIMQQANR